MTKKIIRALAFLLVLALVYGAVDTVLKIKTSDMRSMVMLQKVKPGTVDVVFVGSSHAGLNINNRQIWDETGIPTFNLWGGMQPIWNSYFYLKECIEKQQPKVAMVDVFMCGSSAEFSAKDVALKHVSSMPRGLNRVKMAFESFDKWQDAVEALWGMPYYHSRYDELEANDFHGLYGWDDEIIPTVQPNTDYIFPIEVLDGNAAYEPLALTPKSEKYLRKIVDLCRASDVELVLMVAPFRATEEEYRRYLRVEEIARELDVPFLNFFRTWQETDIDPAKDYSSGGHFNNVGIEKYTRLMEDYLLENFQLADRRSDPSHPWYGVAEQEAAVAAAPVYELTEVFRGDGAQKHVDTGVTMFRQRMGSWTLLTSVDTTPVESGDTVYLSCFSEEDATAYRGLLLRQVNGKLQLILGGNVAVELPETDKQIVNLAIIKDGEAYSVCFDGQWACWQETRSCVPYSGTLLVGCQELSAGGEKFRFSRTCVRDLEVYNAAWTKQQAEAWQPDALPEPAMPLGTINAEPAEVFALQEQFMGDDDTYAQNAYVDTGLKLFESPATRFTLAATILPEFAPGDNVFLSCFSEVPGEYGGLLIRQISDHMMNIVYGENVGLDIPCENGQEMTILVTKDAEVYSVWVNGEKLVSGVSSSVKPTVNTLLLGAQHNSEGRIFRVSSTRVKNLQVFAGVMAEEALLQTALPELPVPADRVAPSVNCALERAFIGNGFDRYADLGVQLFAAEEMAWTLDAVLKTAPQGNAGVYLSCFSEVPGEYRGLLIRQENEELAILLGEHGSLRLPVENGSMHLVITRDGSEYAVYLNGELAGRVSSPCARYEGTLLLGAQVDEHGELFRFSHSRVDSLRVTDGAMNEQDALEASEPIKIESRF